ncbi:hypothetical protein NXS98_07655 [Fontisphaera persica]|uniref:hypothetical protein n=1 Tax=Fontisphaera persica TaxID=2974023 RepID=UPI0024BF4FC4|nr:hypothetical protein [Fontisphaera persica]WCJ60984.1 hypothetical protein NXS98_07655 [Fontisphaera persica]
MKTSSDARNTAAGICVAVQNYITAQSTIEPELKRELAVVNMESLALDENGMTFGFGGLWRFDPAKNKLTSSGYRIGDEHTWYEVRLESVAGKLRVRDVKKQRETVK